VYGTEVFTPEEDSLILAYRNIEILDFLTLSIKDIFIYLILLISPKRAENSQINMLGDKSNMKKFF